MVKLKQSKPIGKLQKGDKVKVNGKLLEVDAHYVFESYDTTKEMLIELFDPKSKKEGEGEYQLRYFDDQVENTMKLYQLKAIMYEETELKSVEW